MKLSIKTVGRITGFAAMLLAALPTAAQEQLTYQEQLARAGDAFQAEDWIALNDHLDAAQEIRTYSLYVWRNRIIARMLAGRDSEALALAETAARRGLVLDLSGHPAFEQLAALPEFAPIAERMEKNAAPIGDARFDFENANAGLLPEALAYDRKNNGYIGSVRTGSVLKLENKNKLSLFTTATGGVFDIEVRGRTLWAAVNNQLAYENADPEAPFASVMAFNTNTGGINREIRVSEDCALLGDLEVAKDGTVYASDSLTPRLFRMAPKGQTLDIYAEDARFANLQGIALDEKNSRIFVADYLTGLFVIDTNTGAVTAIENTADAHLGGIDGLYLYDDSLIGIQNGTTPQRIIRIGLNDDATEVTTFITMQQALEEWNEPTHGAVVGDEFRYIATSNWPSYDQEWNVREDAELQPVRIMSLPLK
jgi:hypothetical protein